MDYLELRQRALDIDSMLHTCDPRSMYFAAVQAEGRAVRGLLNDTPEQRADMDAWRARVEANKLRRAKRPSPHWRGSGNRPPTSPGLLTERAA